MILGVDIGTRGALALLNPQGDLLEVADMPVLRDGQRDGRQSMGCCSRKLSSGGTPSRHSLSTSAQGPTKALLGLSHSAVPGALWKAYWPHVAFRLAT
jgi:hypothetical protein